LLDSLLQETYKMSNTIRWGICSAGLICHDFVNAISSHPEGEHEVVAVAARKLEDAEKFASKHRVKRAYGNYGDLATDKEIDVVYIGAIHPVHLELAKIFLTAGKAVLCEKPLCMNLRETKELVEVARKNKVFLMEAIWSRCLPAYQALKKEIDAGTIGEVKQVIASFGEVIDAPRLHRKDLGGGTVLDLGIYTIQVAHLVLGPDHPTVIAGGHLGEDGCDESTSASLIYSDGRTATLATHTRVKLPNEAHIIGTKGSLVLPYPFWTAIKLVTPSGTQEYPLPTGATYPFTFNNSANMAHESAHVRECLLAGKTESPLVTLDETLTLASIMEQIRKQCGVVYPQDL